MRPQSGLMPNILALRPGWVLAAQLLGTLAILVAVPGNAAKWLAFLTLWAVTFWPLKRSEWVLCVTVCLLFTAMNAAALGNGIFVFARADVLGMPVYELTMWGFYVLHAHRVVAGPIAARPGWDVWALAIAFSAAFGLIHDPLPLLVVTLVILGLALWRHHDRHDLRYAGYMLLLGALIEYAGVWSGEWRYPAAPFGGVPLWFATMWAGVGFFLRRLALPLAQRLDGTQGESLA